MESLQLAQMLADLSSLNATEPAAASSLLNASKAIDSAIENIESGKPQSQSQQHDRPGVRRAVSSISSTGSGTGRFDKFGRHVFGSQPPSRPSSVAATMPGTPTGPQDIEDDVDRASTLMALHDIRAKLKQQDNRSLMRAREKINALVARQQAQEMEQAKHKDLATRKPKYTYPK
ncbi:unnamed protein product [Parascedosporium putredinis]|uniref:Uncharacterized protein n=1 Tax=Parascedosporium putredinis TaxID=1442378 RepID=A0A9P1MCA7_9PEZI|nr:unnamed protein product [Parascedosporium putredinis]CAI7998050.1 unnamed protein product [Parascedosporium putredinis]